MTTLVDQAVERLRSLPSELRDDLARVILQLAGEEQPGHVLSPEELSDLDEADGEIARGELASDDDVRAVWAKHGL